MEEWFTNLGFSDTKKAEKGIETFMNNLKIPDNPARDNYIGDFLFRGILSDRMKMSKPPRILALIHKYHRNNKCPGFYSDEIVQFLITLKFSDFSLFEGWVPDERIASLLNQGIVPINCIKDNEDLFSAVIDRFRIYYPLISDFDTSDYYLDGLEKDFELLDRNMKLHAKIIEGNFIASKDISIITESLELFRKKGIFTNRVLSDPLVYPILLYSNLSFKLNRESRISEEKIIEFIRTDSKVINKLGKCYLTNNVIREFFSVRPKHFYFSKYLIESIKEKGFKKELSEINPIFIEDTMTVSEKDIADIADLDPNTVTYLPIHLILEHANSCIDKYPIILKILTRHKYYKDGDFLAWRGVPNLSDLKPTEEWLKELLLEF